jgi:hypothetical protein
VQSVLSVVCDANLCIEILTRKNELPEVPLAQFFGSVLNKMENPDVVLASHEMSTLLSYPDDSTSALFAWITKGLLMRGHAMANVLLKRLLEFLLDKEVQHCALKALGIVIQESNIALNKNCHCNVKVQFCFSLIVSDRSLTPDQCIL